MRYNRSRCIVVTHTEVGERNEREEPFCAILELERNENENQTNQCVKCSVRVQLYKNALFDGKVLFTLELRSKIVL